MADLPNLDSRITSVNPHYFGEINRTSKNPIYTNFLMVGAIEPERRNCSLLIDAVKYLDSKNLSNFKIIVIGRGDIGVIPDKLKKYFEILGRVSYDVMYSKMETSDFFLPLLDPLNEEHNVKGRTFGHEWKQSCMKIVMEEYKFMR